jgi:choline dehydrogenase-like flavoprotein
VSRVQRPLDPVPVATTAKAFALSDFQLGVDDWDHPLGLAQMCRILTGFAAKRCRSGPNGFDVMACHSLDFCAEDLPHPENRVDHSGGKVHLGGTAHQVGTARCGIATSVLDLDRETHAPVNLYVVDRRCFPAIGAVSPTLTVIAHAVRVGDRISERLK